MCCGMQRHAYPRPRSRESMAPTTPKTLNTYLAQARGGVALRLAMPPRSLAQSCHWVELLRAGRTVESEPERR